MIKLCFVKENMTIMDGVVRVLELLSNELAEEYEVHLLSICGERNKLPIKLKKQIKFKVLKDGNLHIRQTLIPGVKGIREYIQKERIDIVFAVGGGSLPATILGSSFLNVKKVYCEHINLYTSMQHKTDALIRKIFVPYVDRIVTLTEADRIAYLKRFKKFKQKEVVAIHNWMDSNLSNKSVKYNRDARKIISVGRICEQKGFDRLVEIASKVMKENQNWKWDIYGDGPDFEKINEMIKEKGLSDYVELKGNCNNIYSRYKEYALYAMTSRFEGLPMVLLEAKSQGLPIIAFDCKTGPNEIVRNGIDGILVKNNDIAKFQEILNELIKSPDLRSSFSNKSMENVDKFEKKNIVSQWQRLINDLVM